MPLPLLFKNKIGLDVSKTVYEINEADYERFDVICEISTNENLQSAANTIADGMPDFWDRVYGVGLRFENPLDPAMMDEDGDEESFTQYIFFEQRKETITQTINDSWEDSKQIVELSRDDLANYRLLGVAHGANFDHCAEIGLRQRKNFWHEVVACHTILPDEETPTVTGIRQFFAEHFPRLDYIAVAFYGIPGQAEEYPVRFANIPQQLTLADHPEFSVFPESIIFSLFETVGQQTSLNSIEYLPDLNSYCQSNDEQILAYHNVADKHQLVYLRYDRHTADYTGTRYRDGKVISVTNGVDWDRFFSQLTTSIEF